ncbi:MAG: helix-turn-helix transcriptional regulator [Anaerotruncus sp.]|nr:helix-turn-helix transcriptional regulator [Anaerotruncus sp.]
MTIYDEIGETIVSARKEKKLTQEQLALECDISVSYLRCIEHGSANPTINELHLIAKALQLELRNPLAVPASIRARL